MFNAPPVSEVLAVLIAAALIAVAWSNRRQR